jgi:hypothetical protein
MRVSVVAENHPKALRAAFALAFIVTVVLISAAALGVWPFEGTVGLLLLGYILEGVAHGVLAALIVTSVVDLHPHLATWNRRDSWKKAATIVATVVLIIGLSLVGYYVVENADSSHIAVYFILAALSVLSIAVLRVGILNPQKFDAATERIGVFGGMILGGVAAGVVIMVAVVTYATYTRQSSLDNKDPATVERVVGNFSPTKSVRVPIYLEIGDSYSAGEGIMPFEAGTQTGGVGNGCHRSSEAYSQLLVFKHPVSPIFVACSGAVIADFYSPRRGVPTVPPQVLNLNHDNPADVGLITLTAGGNDIGFSTIVRDCFEEANCLNDVFVAPSSTHGSPALPESAALTTWAPAALNAVGKRELSLYRSLRKSFPKARIIAIGYPYLFSDVHAGWQPNDCAADLRRISLTERLKIRGYQDQLNNLMYERAVQAGVEFISPKSAWEGHESCGTRVQFTNALKIVDSGGSFHPTPSGQKQLAAVLACYLNDNPKIAPNPFLPSPKTLAEKKTFLMMNIDGINNTKQLGLQPAPGQDSPIVCPTERK